MARRPKKTNQPPARTDDGWFSRGDMQRVFGLSPSGFDKSIRPFARDDAIRREGRNVFFHAPTLLARWGEWKYGQDIGDEDAALLAAAGSDSPALERLREAKAKLAELDYLERTQQLVHIEHIRAGLGAIASRLRDMAEQAQRIIGPVAFDLIDEALTDCEKAIDVMYGSAAPHEEDSLE